MGRGDVAVTTVVIELDPQVAGHLAVAIEMYRRELHKVNGWNGPTGLEELGDVARNRARAGQGGTDIADLATSLQDRRVTPLLLSKREAAQALDGVRADRLELDVAALPSRPGASLAMASVRSEISDTQRFLDRLSER